MTATRVLLADDHEMVRAGFRIILGSQADIEVVGEAATGTEALARAAELQPDVICMDVQMPDMDGLEATRRITSNDDGTSAVLILTTFDRDDYLFEALSAGASGFLLKNSTPEQLIDAVRVVAAGDALLAPAVTRRVIERFGSRTDAPASGAGTSPVSRPAALDTLTERESEVLTLVAQGLSNAEIAQQLFVGEATVKSHVSKVLQKLGLRDRIQAVVYAYEHGVAVPGS
ncbi:response regulator [Mycetocola zhadangensis]|uniref:DNA-binding response regulator n=1 Tax=Mycetocola zhadangensis TaxID=1164595 RepID=A0A3L7J7D7_9MICO|nr:response regulator transcription factor [Mycetocola zhadangensis]RLQ84422.1 DNA-binding response regulator [Mycetocola zhadangensis]GGE93153.1 DNA-binding response regulator [Mycetocola zhadangensis]